MSDIYTLRKRTPRSVAKELDRLTYRYEPLNMYYRDRILELIHVTFAPMTPEQLLNADRNFNGPLAELTTQQIQSYCQDLSDYGSVDLQTNEAGELVVFRPKIPDDVAELFRRP